VARVGASAPRRAWFSVAGYQLGRYGIVVELAPGARDAIERRERRISVPVAAGAVDSIITNEPTVDRLTLGACGHGAVMVD
jgi:hypothetical protein